MRIVCYFTCSFLFIAFVHSMKDKLSKMGLAISFPSNKKKDKDKKHYRELLEMIHKVNTIKINEKIDVEIDSKTNEKYIHPIMRDNDLNDFINTL